jgi:hypothetical protein
MIMVEVGAAAGIICAIFEPCGAIAGGTVITTGAAISVLE